MKGMKKIVALLPLLLLINHCRILDIDSEPGIEREFESISLRFQAKGPDSRVNGKINCRLSGPDGVFYFFTPLNQVVARMYTENEQVLLVPEKKNGCWRGSFHELVGSYWSLELSLREWIDILKNGEAAEEIPASIQCNVTMSDPSGRPQRLILESGQITLTLVITKREWRRGRFPLASANKCRRMISLEEIFTDG